MIFGKSSGKKKKRKKRRRDDHRQHHERIKQEDRKARKELDEAYGRVTTDIFYY
jgi:hypothetical protein